jgi:hypothetical protein
MQWTSVKLDSDSQCTVPVPQKLKPCEDEVPWAWFVLVYKIIRGP